MTDYSDLNDNVRNYTETDTNVLSDAVILPFIESIEDQLLRTVDLTYFRKYDYATLTVGNPFFTFAWRLAKYKIYSNL